MAHPVERATSREKGQPLCMKQFYRLMTTVRNPGNPKDQQVTADVSTDYIVVARHSQASPGGSRTVVVQCSCG